MRKMDRWSRAFDSFKGFGVRLFGFHLRRFMDVVVKS
jgi:hypothetical protein